MNTKLILSVVTGVMLTGAFAFAASGNDQGRSRTKVRAAKQTATMTTSGNAAVRTHHMAISGNTALRTRNVTTRGTTAVQTRNVSGRTVYVGGTRYSYGYPYSSYGYPYSYSYGYPYYSYGPSLSFGFGDPYYSGYYPYGYSYGYSNYYPYDYSYGYYRSGYGNGYNGSVVAQVQTRLARAGYYRGPIDGVMGSGTRYAIRAYERDHGLRMDGVIGGPLLRSMGLRY